MHSSRMRTACLLTVSGAGGSASRGGRGSATREGRGSASRGRGSASREGGGLHPGVKEVCIKRGVSIQGG